ncbi:unnamed protein product, partial [Prorocentrum cordatum]
MREGGGPAALGVRAALWTGGRGGGGLLGGGLAAAGQEGGPGRAAPGVGVHDPAAAGGLPPSGELERSQRRITSRRRSIASSVSSGAPAAARECVAARHLTIPSDRPLTQEEELLLQVQQQEEEAEYEELLSFQRERRLERTRRLEELNAFWQKKVSFLEAEIGQHTKQLQQKCHELEE